METKSPNRNRSIWCSNEEFESISDVWKFENNKPQRLIFGERKSWSKVKPKIMASPISFLKQEVEPKRSQVDEQEAYPQRATVKRRYLPAGNG
ncbi:hypothetical protein RUM43_014720 [Polyplax serrata]|uniref:Uncharacterized protein n=1 Tax=Polyplax serrata TaxID=468196 RepID=A0AAN8NQ81_POLSC